LAQPHLHFALIAFGSAAAGLSVAIRLDLSWWWKAQVAGPLQEMLRLRRVLGAGC